MNDFALLKRAWRDQKEIFPHKCAHLHIFSRRVLLPAADIVYCVLGEGGKIRSSSCVHKKPFPSITNSSSIGVQDKTSRIEGKQCQSQILPHGCNSIPPTNHIMEMLWMDYKIVFNMILILNFFIIEIIVTIVLAEDKIEGPWMLVIEEQWTGVEWILGQKRIAFKNSFIQLSGNLLYA